MGPRRRAADPQYALLEEYATRQEANNPRRLNSNVDTHVSANDLAQPPVSRIDYSSGETRWTASADVRTGTISKSIKSFHRPVHSSSSARLPHSMIW